MAGPLPRAITVTPMQQAVLEGLLRQHSCPQALARRVASIVGAAAGERNEPLAARLGCTPNTIRRLRSRWAAAQLDLATVDDDEARLGTLLRRCWPMPHVPACPPPLAPNKSSRSSTWPARPLPMLAAPWTPGRHAS